MKKVIISSLLIIIFSCHSQEKDRINKEKEILKQIEIPINPKTMKTYTNEEFTKEDVENYKKTKEMEIVIINILETMAL
jgi:hypothetical protein